VFRIFQEALTNIARHANASSVTARLVATPEQLVLEVHDNGRGITEAEASDAHSLGLLGMRERALSWGGEISIRVAQGGGTTITVRVPLSPTSQAAMES
jgi:signal transduction histidine kinase